MTTRLKPLQSYSPRAYPQARGTAVGKLLLAASMAATSLGGCGPAVDPHTVDDTVDSGDLDATQDAPESDQVATDSQPNADP